MKKVHKLILSKRREANARALSTYKPDAGKTFKRSTYIEGAKWGDILFKGKGKVFNATVSCAKYEAVEEMWSKSIHALPYIRDVGYDEYATMQDEFMKIALSEPKKFEYGNFYEKGYRYGVGLTMILPVDVLTEEIVAKAIKEFIDGGCKHQATGVIEIDYSDWNGHTAHAVAVV